MSAGSDTFLGRSYGGLELKCHAPNAYAILSYTAMEIVQY